MDNKKILLIGLDIIFADTLATALRDSGAKVDSCSDSNAMELISQDHDLLMIDATADLTLIKKAKSSKPHACAIILADMQTLPPPAEIIRLGAVDYFIKSCDLKHLLFRIERCLQFVESQEKLLAKNIQLEKEIATKEKVKDDMRHRLQFYQTMIDAIDQSLYVVDVKDYTVKMANKACSFYQNYNGQKCYELTHGSDTPCCGDGCECSIAEIKKTGKPVTIGHLHVNDKGEETTVEVHTFPIFDDDGELVQVVEYCADVSERTQLQKQLSHAQKMESIATMAAGISHDFNNILTVILGFSDLAYSLLADDNEVKPYLDEVLKAGRRARELVSQILTFSREAELTKQAVLLTPIVKETVKLLKASLPATIELSFDIDEECGMVMAEPTQIHQVLMNICSNAFQAMVKDGGKLEINMDMVYLDEGKSIQGLPVGSYVRLQVVDTGVGMDPVTMERIFEPYFSTKAQGAGSGLGLSVAYGIIAAHNGEITVSSELGKGAVFSIYLPEFVESKSEPQSDVQPDFIGTGEHLIFVDDEDAIVSLGKKILERMGYKVTAFTSSIEALAAFKSADSFDLLLTDYTMPKMTGIDLISKIRQQGIDTPAILISGYNLTADILAKADELGVNSIIKKPFGYEVLAKAVKDALRHS